MTKLVTILARELGEWPEKADAFVQDANRKAWAIGGSFQSLRWYGKEWLLAPDVDCHALEKLSSLATDHATAIVTRKMWEAERERLEDEKDAATVRERRGQETVQVDPDTLTQWRGPQDGLPPAGTVCEVWHDTGRECWHRGVIVGPHPEFENYAAAAITKGSQVDFLVWSNEFRPIRTDREKWIEAAAEACGNLLSADGTALGMIYDKMIAKLPE